MKLYQISDGTQIFESSDKKKLSIRNYTDGLRITIDNQMLLKNLLLFLENPRSTKEILSVMPELSDEILVNVLNEFVKLNIIDCKKSLTSQEKTKILIIGLGTTGGYLVEALCRSDIDLKLFIADPDYVDITNVGRQIYLNDDVGKYKVDVLRNKFATKDMEVFKIFIDTEDCLERICKENCIDLVIQCGDSPSPRKLGSLVNTVCNKLNLPYIINTGYMSNVIPLPEFYYPNNSYNFHYKHEFSDEKLLLTQVLNKADYSVAVQPSFIMLEQIRRFIHNEQPIYYQYRGYYSSKTLTWEVEKID